MRMPDCRICKNDKCSLTGTETHGLTSCSIFCHPDDMPTDADVAKAEAIDKAFGTQHDECQKAHREVGENMPTCFDENEPGCFVEEVVTDGMDPAERRVDRLGPAGQESKICYQCEKRVVYLFDDGRCKDCTRLTTEEVRGEE